MNSCLTEHKPEIEYPCLWQYKVIGTDKVKVLAAISSVVCNKEHTLCESKTSSTGKYLSVNLEMEVRSEDMRNRIFMELQRHPSLRMII